MDHCSLIKRFMLPEIECAALRLGSHVPYNVSDTLPTCVEVVDICLHTVVADCTIPTGKCNSMLA